MALGSGGCVNYGGDIVQNEADDAGVEELIQIEAIGWTKACLHQGGQSICWSRKEHQATEIAGLWTIAVADEAAVEYQFVDFGKLALGHGPNSQNWDWFVVRWG
jgi:hypothetical protein